MKPRLLIFLDSPDWLPPVLIGVGIFSVVAVLAWLAIKRYIKPTTPELKKEAVTLLFQALGGTAFLLGVYFTWQQLANSRKELQNSRDMLVTTQQGQITERFTRAIEQLGKGDEGEAGTRGARAGADSQKNLALRLGGIYALERIAKDSDPDHPVVMEVLTAFVRQHSALAEESGGGKTVQRDIRPDIQAILTVIGRRDLTYKKGESQRLNLSGTDLRWVILNGAKLDGVDLTSARLDSAQLKDAELREAILTDAHFTDAILEGAQLQGADLRGADLRRAKVAGVKFDGVNLSGADLSGAEGLTREQLDSAKTDGATLTDLRATGKP
jgi:Pentapeptide repeats (8 copies)